MMIDGRRYAYACARPLQPMCACPPLCAEEGGAPSARAHAACAGIATGAQCTLQGAGPPPAFAPDARRSSAAVATCRGCWVGGCAVPSAGPTLLAAAPFFCLRGRCSSLSSNMAMKRRPVRVHVHHPVSTLPGGTRLTPTAYHGRIRECAIELSSWGISIRAALKAPCPPTMLLQLLGQHGIESVAAPRLRLLVRHRRILHAVSIYQIDLVFPRLAYLAVPSAQECLQAAAAAAWYGSSRAKAKALRERFTAVEAVSCTSIKGLPTAAITSFPQHWPLQVACKLLTASSTHTH